MYPHTFRSGGPGPDLNGQDNAIGDWFNHSHHRHVKRGSTRQGSRPAPVKIFPCSRLDNHPLRGYNPLQMKTVINIVFG